MESAAGKPPSCLNEAATAAGEQDQVEADRASRPFADVGGERPGGRGGTRVEGDDGGPVGSASGTDRDGPASGHDGGGLTHGVDPGNAGGPAGGSDLSDSVSGPSDSSRSTSDLASDLESGADVEVERDGTTVDLDALFLSEDSRSDIVSRLKRIEGQARGIRKMIEDGRSCEDVVIQVAALKAAVTQVGIAIAGSHLVDCVARNMEASPQSRAALAKFVKIFSKLS